MSFAIEVQLQIQPMHFFSYIHMRMLSTIQVVANYVTLLLRSYSRSGENCAVAVNDKSMGLLATSHEPPMCVTVSSQVAIITR